MPEDIDPERLVREVTFAVEGDGRTIEARIVPYGVETQVVDSPQHGGTGIPYLERWLPGVFQRQSKAVDKVKVWLNFEHEPGLRGIVGHGTVLREEPDALYGTFRVHSGTDGDKALQMVNDGILTGLSVEAIPNSSRQTPEGIVERVKATLDKVALCRFPAYQGAEVLAVREAPDEEEPPAPEPTPPDPERSSEVDEVLKRVGIEPMLRRAMSTRPWSGTPARFTDEEYMRSALICRTGDAPPKERCSLPVLEPNGDLNTHALGSAASRLSQVTGISAAQRSQAARKLMRYYRQADMEVPEVVRALASR